MIGTRAPEKARELVSAIEAFSAGGVTVATYQDAVSTADLIVLAVPYAVHAEILDSVRSELQGKILVDAVVPLVPPKVSVVQLPKAGSAAIEAQAIVGSDVKVVSAFHNVGAKKLHEGAKADCDVLVFGDDAEARSLVASLALEVATGSVEAGTLANSAAAEALTSTLIWINRRYKVSGAGVKITGLPSPD